MPDDAKSRSSDVNAPGGVMTDEAGVITGELTLRSELSGATVTLRSYAAAEDSTFDRLRRLAAVRPASALSSAPASVQEAGQDAGQKPEGVARFRNRRPVVSSRPTPEEDGDARLAGVIQGLSEALAQPSVDKNERFGA